MKKMIFPVICLLLGTVLSGCTGGNQPETTDESVETPAASETVDTESDEIIPLTPEEVAASLFADAAPLAISTVCHEVTIPGMDLAAVQNAFMKHGYTLIPTKSVDGTKLQTAVLSDTEWVVTLIETSGGSLHVLWEKADEVSIAPLTPDENALQGEVKLVQLGTAREDENKDNPMIGMCYVYRLGDGTAVIIDGGYNTRSCSQNIWRALKKLDIAKNDEDKYVITAWIFTHGHDDHVGAFQYFARAYGKKTTLTYVMHGIPVDDVGVIGNSAPDFDATVREYYPDALRVSPHAGLRYYFGNLSIDELYNPELLYTSENKITWYNNTSLIMRYTANGHSALFFGDAGEQAATAAWTENDAAAFVSDFLQITHHGLYTNGEGEEPESHIWDNIKHIYDATGASVGLLPMGTRKATSAFSGRYLTIIERGLPNARQVTYVTNPRDDHGLDVTEECYDQFLADVAAGTAAYDTLLGYDGVNIWTNEAGMTTYMSAAELEPMATEFALTESGITVVDNDILDAWLH